MTSQNEKDPRLSTPLLLEYTSETQERWRQEELYTPPSRTLQWCLAPLVFLGSMIPASALLIHVLHIHNRQAETAHHGVTLIPTLSVGVDIMGIAIVFVSAVGLFGVVRGCKRLMNVYFAFVLCFIGYQVVYTIVGFNSGAKWTIEALERSWDKAYNSDQELIREMQSEFGCQGFRAQDDRAGKIASDGMYPACADILQAKFGKKLEKIGYLILCIRMIQLTGVFLLSILFKHLASVDTADEEEERGDEESYFISEKQMEEEGSKVPLLADKDDDDEDLPPYGDASDSEGDDEDRDRADEESGFQGRYRYHDLPEYKDEPVRVYA
ncbi:hypothetical protein CPB97_004179 [Podila verticillata]|nr:hypothetical protein CPB97_004179 [Podila verticillata]